MGVGLALGCPVDWTGLLGQRSAGLLGQRSAGLPGQRSAGLLGCRAVGATVNRVLLGWGAVGHDRWWA